MRHPDRRHAAGDPLPELVESRWLAPPADAATLAAVTGDVFADEHGRQEEARRLLEEVRTAWSPESSAAALSRLYRGLLHGRHE